MGGGVQHSKKGFSYITLVVKYILRLLQKCKPGSPEDPEDPTKSQSRGSQRPTKGQPKANQRPTECKSLGISEA